MISQTTSSWIHKCLYDIRLHKIVIVVFAFVLYANTLGHEFVLDDGIVITENKFVKEGIKGIPDILSKDSFYGFFKKQGKEKLVAGGRYRPMSLVLFAIVYNLFGDDPFIFHLFSILWYCALGLLLYTVLKKLLTPLLESLSIPFAFIASMLFVTHPVHTECVANIKGADEILALLGSVGAFYFALKYSDTQKMIYLFYSGLVFLLALLSKENAIVYLAIIPASVFLLYQKSYTPVLKISVFLLAACIFFIYMRSQILGFNPFSGNSTELMNNPFLVLEQGVSKPMSAFDRAGIIGYSLFEYLRLLIFPHPLTHDYYPKHIPVLGLFSTKSILAYLCYFGMLSFAILRIKKHPVISMSIWCYILPLFLVSNILFPIGTNMGERFLFMPSVGFCILLAYLLIHTFSSALHYTVYISGIVIFLYSIKTIERNPAWENNFTLFTTDVKVSKNSAKIHNGIAGVLLEKVPELNDSTEIRNITAKARTSLNKALAIHPLYTEAQLQMGNIHYFEKNYEEAIKQYNIVLKRLPEEEDAFKNLQMALRERGRQIGMQTGNIQLAKDFLKQSVGMNPNDAEAVMLMGIAEGSAANFTEALKYFYKATELEPKNAQAYFNLGITYKNIHNEEKADSMFKHAKDLDPEIFEKNGMSTK
jgi:protein O-mannosyl-transferase